MAVRNCAEVGENLIKIVKRLLANDDLVKLLYYNDKDPLSHDALTDEEKQTKIFDKLIKVIPYVGTKDTANSVLAIRVLDGIPLQDNLEFRKVTIAIQIFTPFVSWTIKNTNLRPFLIMGEIQKSLAGKRLNGIGVLNHNGFSLSYLTDDISCYEMTFDITTYD